MGMSASQYSLLQYTKRKNHIGFELTVLSNQKQALTRDMERVSREHQEALSCKTLKWSANGGASYVDLSYSNLMKPSSMNQNKPYLLTDSSDRVVVDSTYRKYAEMISENGAPGDWESVRTQVLSEITGIDASKIDSVGSYSNTVLEKEKAINDLIENEPKLPTEKGDIEEFLEYTKLTASSIGVSKFSKGSNLAEAYDQGGTVDLGGVGTASATLQRILDSLYNQFSPYLDNEAKEALKDGCDTFMLANQAFIQGNDEQNKKTLEEEYTAIGGNSSNYTLNISNLIDSIFATVPTETNKSGIETFEWADKNAATYNQDKAKYEAWEKSLEAAKEEYSKAVEANNMLLTSDQEKTIKFYDAIFSAIAEKGWVANSSVEDQAYLNQMLQNGTYTLTEVSRESEYDEDSEKYVMENDYKTDIASNFKNIFMVNDNDAREIALIKYENEKRIISAKETKIDTRMKNLETEQAAINQMIQSIEQVKNDNIDRTMNVFG